MKKRILSLLLILVMTLSLLPTAVLADESEIDYGITVVSPEATTQNDVTSKNYTDVMGDGTVSYDPDTKVLTLNGARLGCIRASQIRETLTLRLVGDNTITTPQGVYSNALTMKSLSIEGDGTLHVKAQLYAANFYAGISYQQSGGEVTLEGFGLLNGGSGPVKLTGGTLTLLGGMPQMDRLLDAPDGTTLELFDEDGEDLGSWVLPTDSTNWSGLLSTATKLELTAPAVFGEASLAALKKGETYYFDLSSAGIPTSQNGSYNDDLPDKSLHYVPFTYAGVLDGGQKELYRWTSETRVEIGSWPLFVADCSISHVSWNELCADGLIYGKPYDSNGVTYTLRAPSGSDLDDRGYVCERNIIKDEYIKPDTPETFWGQDYYNNSKKSATILSSTSRRSFTWPIVGPNYYRPVLQPTNLYGKALRVVTLVVNGTSYNVITAEDTVSLPSINGLLGDEDALKDGYYWHDAENSKYYGPGEDVPVTDNMTLTAVPRGYEIIITDKDGKEHLVTEINKADVFGDGTVSYDPDDPETGISSFKGVLTLKDAKLQGISCLIRSLALKLEGNSRIDAEDKAFAIQVVGNLTIQGDGSLSVSVKDGRAITQPPHLFYVQNGGHVTLPESALTDSGKLKFNGGTLTLLGEGDEAFKYFDLTNGDFAKYTELRLVCKDGTVHSRKHESLEMGDWYELMSEVEGSENIEKVHLIADGAELPPEDENPEKPEELEKPSIEPILIGGSMLLTGGDRNPFSDVRAIDWYYDDVMYAYDRGLIRGTAYNKFSPKDTFTRGMLLTILARHDGVRTKDSTPWYASGCDWAVRNGISDGKNPEEAVSREEFALTLYRYAQYRGSSMLSGNDLSSFTDANAVTDEALPAVQWAVSEAILRGDNFYLHPQSGATRAEAAAMLHRFFAR